MTNQQMPGDFSPEQAIPAQSAKTTSSLQESINAARSEQKAASDSIFNKPGGNGVQYGSMPVVDGEAGKTSAASGALPFAPISTATGSNPRAGKQATGGFAPIKPGSSGTFAPVRQGASETFSQVGAPATDAQLGTGGQRVVQGQSATRAPINNARPIILFDRVSKVYPAQPKKPALNNISMTISSGEFVFLVGHSGSGKSTFIRLINHEFVVSSGRLVVAGEDLSSIKKWRVPYLRRNIGCVFQDFKLLPNKTAFQNVAFALEVIGKSKHIIRTQVPEVLRLVGLEDKMDKLPDQLSGGEQQRVSIARAIVNRPPMLICDEPTGNLDPQTSLGIMRLLDRINRTGTTIVVATHDREMVDSMRKRVIALENGFLVRDEDKGVYGLDA